MRPHNQHDNWILDSFPNENLNEGQRQFHDILTEVWNYEGKHSSINGDVGVYILIFLRWCDSTGKSVAMNTLKTILETNEKLVMDTTGKAATIIGRVQY